MNHKPVAITMGDPAGIGPEIIVAAWNQLPAETRSRIFVVGRAQRLVAACKIAGIDVEVCTIAELPAEFSPRAIHCLEVADRWADEIPIGQCSAEAGEVAYQAIVAATRLAIEQRIAAVVTAPINKRALHLAGHNFPGHTELIADMCGVKFVVMMLYLSQAYVQASTVGLGVSHVTLHQPLRQAIDSLDSQMIFQTSELTCQFFDRRLRASQIDRPSRVAVAALNPHGGERGLFGREELDIIQPAVEAGIAAGLPLVGPLPCDTLMARAVMGEFDAVVAMYHDQGHIAFKLLNMHRAVNVTLGLPIVRTSPAHGTAFELAGSGKADHGGMLEALRLADQLACNG